jgi:hypothetical protein
LGREGRNLLFVLFSSNLNSKTMKTIHSIILGMLSVFTLYFYILAFSTGNDDYSKLGTYLMMVSFAWWQVGQIAKYKTLYEEEKKKNEDLVNGIHETRSLIKKALVNKN